MKKFIATLILLITVTTTFPVYAGDSHAGRPGSDGGTGILRGDSHAGRPGSPGTTLDGRLGVTGFSQGSSLSGGWRGNKIYRPMIYPLGVPGIFFDIFSYALGWGPFGFF
jgi:hypothetical protein